MKNFESTKNNSKLKAKKNHDTTRNLVEHIEKISKKDIEWKKSKKKSLEKNAQFKIDNISEDLYSIIENEKVNLKNTRRNQKRKKINYDLFEKINMLVEAWVEKKKDLNLLNRDEINFFKMRPSNENFFFIIFKKVNSAIRKVIRTKYDEYKFLDKLSDQAQRWVLSKMSSLKIPYDLKIKKMLFFIEAIEANDPRKNLYLLTRRNYLYVMDFPDILEGVFENNINFRIYRLLKIIKITINPSALFSNTSDNILQVKNGYKIYSSSKNNSCVLKDINLEVKKGEFILLLGPSGSGKTSLMNCLAGIDQLSFGDIVVNNINITKLTDHSLTRFRLENISYIFQHYGLLPNLNVYENIMMGDFLRNQDYSWKTKKQQKRADRKFIDWILKEFEIFEEKEKMVYELSGGQQQRVAIARSIAKKGLLIFADEPTSALDHKTSKKAITFLQKLCLEHKQTIIMITHDEKTIDYASRIIRLKDGRIIEDVQTNNLANLLNEQKEKLKVKFPGQK